MYLHISIKINFNLLLDLVEVGLSMSSNKRLCRSFGKVQTLVKARSRYRTRSMRKHCATNSTRSSIVIEKSNVKVVNSRFRIGE